MVATSIEYYIQVKKTAVIARLSNQCKFPGILIVWLFGGFKNLTLFLPCSSLVPPAYFFFTGIRDGKKSPRINTSSHKNPILVQTSKTCLLLCFPIPHPHFFRKAPGVLETSRAKTLRRGERQPSGNFPNLHLCSSSFRIDHSEDHGAHGFRCSGLRHAWRRQRSRGRDPF